MIFLNGNILESKCKFLVNPVNCAGVMGKGLAAQFKKKFPDMFHDYRLACNEKSLKPGGIHRYGNIINVATKDHWKAASRIEYIREFLICLRNFLTENPNTSVAIPALGCGCGELEWTEVKKLMEFYLRELPSKIEIYEPIALSASV